MAKSPTQMTLDWLEEHGYVADVCERIIPHANRKKDLFGAFDIVAMPTAWPSLSADAVPSIIGIQTTTMSNRSARIKKMTTEPVATMVRLWIANGGRAEVWAWAKHKIIRGGERYRWDLERMEVNP